MGLLSGTNAQPPPLPAPTKKLHPINILLSCLILKIDLCCISSPFWFSIELVCAGAPSKSHAFMRQTVSWQIRLGVCSRWAWFTQGLRLQKHARKWSMTHRLCSVAILELCNGLRAVLDPVTRRSHAVLPDNTAVCASRLSEQSFEFSVTQFLGR